MTKVFEPGQGLLYMKVGTHAQEPLDEIIARKTKEIESTGVAFWGYGGSTCHPQTMVQPFAKIYERQGNVIYLCMELIDSSHFAEAIRADEYSIDGLEWKEVPRHIDVLGSRYALVIKNLRTGQFDLHLKRTKVALGNSRGTNGSRYVRGRVDKACLVVTEEAASEAPEESSAQIGLVAELVNPYAVYVRNRDP